jgi:pyruvate/2-oxoglutarate dehydrogenase complex dihydrolipoamide dehydrogenase (E3) component
VTEKFDAIIVGAGQAGPPLAGRLTQAGQKVAVIERKLVGGTCVNYGCIPTKTLVASAHAAHLARRGSEYGVGTGDITVDMAKVKARKDKVMLGDRDGLESWLSGMDGCTFIRGHARFEDPHTLRVDGRVLEADRIFLNVGGRAVAPDMPGLSDIDYMTNVGILELDTLPEHLVIIGGSYIALEFAQMYRRFGARVTVIEKGPRLTSREDEDVSATIKEILEAEGIDVVVDANAIQFTKRDNGFDVIPRGGAAPITPTPTTWASNTPGWRPTTAATSSWTTSCAPMSNTSGRWGTATVAARSPIPRTTTSRSLPPTCSTTIPAGSPTGSPPTRSTSIRRWAVLG